MIIVATVSSLVLKLIFCLADTVETGEKIQMSNCPISCLRPASTACVQPLLLAVQHHLLAIQHRLLAVQHRLLAFQNLLLLSSLS